MKAKALLVLPGLLLLAGAALLVQLDATAQGAGCAIDAVTCKGLARLETDTGGLLGATRCWQVSTDLADTDSCDDHGDTTWEMSACATTVTVKFLTDTTGATPPSAPDTILIQLRFDATATVIRTLHNGAPPADGTTWEIGSTDTGECVAPNFLTAGTFRLYIQAVFDGITGDYDIDTDGNAPVGNIVSRARGALRGTFQSPGNPFELNGPGTNVLYTEGTSGPASASIASRFPWGPNGDAGLETLRYDLYSNDGSTVKDSGTMNDYDGNTSVAQMFRIWNLLDDSLTTYAIRINIVGNSALTGLKWTRWVDTVDSQFTRDSDTSITRPNSLVADPRVIFSTTAAASCTTSTSDSSGNGHTLTANGSPTCAPSFSEYGKFKTGYAFATSGSLTRSGDAALAITGDLSATMTFWSSNHYDMSASDDQTMFNVGQGATDYYVVWIESTGSDGKLYYRHSGISPISSSIIVPPGPHLLTLRRDSTLKHVTIQLDGTAYIDSDYSTNPTTGTGTHSFAMSGPSNGGGGFLNGSIMEARIWDSLIPQSTLDAISSTTGTSIAEGTEEAYWRLDSDQAGAFYSTADNDITSNHELYNRGESATLSWFMLNANSSALTRSLTFTLRDSASTQCDSFTDTGASYGETRTISTTLCLAANDAVGTAWHLRAAASGLEQNSDPGQFFVTSLYLLDMHNQRTLPLVEDSFPMDDENEDFTFISGEDIVHSWCHAMNARNDAFITTSPTQAFTLTLKDPDMVTVATDTRVSVAVDEGWTNPVWQNTAEPPIGTWTIECTITFNGNTATDVEEIGFISAFTGSNICRFAARIEYPINTQTTIYVNVESNDLPIEPDRVPQLKISHVSASETWVDDQDFTPMINVVNDTATVNGSLYRYEFTHTHDPSLALPHAINYLVQCRIEGQIIRFQQSASIISQAQDDAQQILTGTTLGDTSTLNILILAMIVFASYYMYRRAADAGVRYFWSLLILITSIATLQFVDDWEGMAWLAAMFAFFAAYLMIRTGMDQMSNKGTKQLDHE